MSEKSSEKLDWDFTKSDDVLSHMKFLANRLIELVKNERKTKEAAIDWLRDEYRFGTFLRRLDRGDKVSDSMSMCFRLRKALEDAVERQDRLLERDRQVLAEMRRGNARDHGAGLPAGGEICG